MQLRRNNHHDSVLLGSDVVLATPDVQRLALSMVPGVASWRHTPETCVVLATDGVWDVVSNTEAARFISSRAGRQLPSQQQPSLAEIAGELLDHCFSPRTGGAHRGQDSPLGSTDNMTCAIVQFAEGCVPVPTGSGSVNYALLQPHRPGESRSSTAAPSPVRTSPQLLHRHHTPRRPIT